MVESLKESLPARVARDPSLVSVPGKTITRICLIDEIVEQLIAVIKLCDWLECVLLMACHSKWLAEALHRACRDARPDLKVIYWDEETNDQVHRAQEGIAAKSCPPPVAPAPTQARRCTGGDCCEC